MSVSIEGAFGKQMFTDGYGNSTRLRVDDAETEFYDGRDIRAFKEWSLPLSTHIPAGQRQIFRFTIGVDTVIINAEYQIDNGQIRVTTYAGGTPTGTFDQVMPVVKANGMSTAPAHTIQNSVSYTLPGTSGTVNISGGTAANITRLKTSTGSGNAVSIGSTPDSKLGIAPGIYYTLVENIGVGDVEGTVHYRWWESAV